MTKTNCCLDSTLYYTDKLIRHSECFLFLKELKKKGTLLTKYLQNLAMHSMFSNVQ